MQILKYPQDFKALQDKVVQPKLSLEVETIVKKIVEKVRLEGNQALSYFTREFDGIDLPPENLKVSETEFGFDELEIPNDFKEAVAIAIDNISQFHQQQLPEELVYQGKYGEKLGQRFTAIEKVGVYIPGGVGGKTPLISTLMMNVIPAQIAGCQEIVAVTPPQIDLSINPYLLYTFKKLGMREVYKVGGAQAVAALAYGTENIPSVDIIVGPGNQYVTAAKKQVFGQVMIDGLYGHSEIVVVSDGSVPADHIACDLLSQAEHAGGELVVLITDQEEHAKEVLESIEKEKANLERKKEINGSLNNRGCVVLVDSLAEVDEVANLVNYIAPEHLELLVEIKEEEYLKKISHTGAIFVGGHASEPIGDYICGTNHVLPTGRSARFSSPLGVYTFLKRTNIIEYNQASFAAYAKYAEVLAKAEGLTAHARALSVRNNK